MAVKRKIEIFSADCPVCRETVEKVKGLACPSCDIQVLDTRKGDVAARAKALGIRSIPAVVVDGKLVACCEGLGVEEEMLRRAGIGQP